MTTYKLEIPENPKRDVWCATLGTKITYDRYSRTYDDGEGTYTWVELLQNYVVTDEEPPKKVGDTIKLTDTWKLPIGSVVSPEGSQEVYITGVYKEHRHVSGTILRVGLIS